jgi:hypothetical protein
VSASAFFEPDGGGFAATELTRGPWDPGHQHAGPPAALLARALEREPCSRPMEMARVTFEILRPIPIAPRIATARVARAGRSTELLEGSLSDPDGEVMRASGWRIRRSKVDLERDGAALAESNGAAPASPDESEPVEFFDFGSGTGYHTAIESRVAAGSFLAPGPATVWLRMRYPLVAGEAPSPLARVLVAADSGNGVSWTLDLRRYLFINVDLSVHLHRPPDGEWVCLDAATTPETSGVGLADTRLWDAHGTIGRSLQTLLIDRRRTGTRT